MKNICLLFSALLYFCSFVVSEHFFPWLSFYQDYLIFSSLFFLVLGVRRIKLSLVFVVLLCVSLVPLIQYICGVVYFFGDAVFCFFYLFAFALVFSLGGGLHESREKVFAAFCGLIVFCGLFSVWVALSQWLLSEGHWLHSAVSGWRVSANFAQPNNFSTFMFLAVFASVYLFLEKKIGLAVLGVVVFLFIFCAALAQSRVSLILVVFFVLFVFFFRSFLGGWLLISTLSSFFYFLLFLYLPSVGCELYLQGPCSAGERFVQGQRIGLWLQLWEALRIAPWYGYGWGQVSVAQSAVSNIYPNPLMVEHSHNLVLDLLLWNGYFLGGLLVVFLLFVFVLFLRGVRDGGSFLALMMLLAVGLHSFFEFPLEYALFLLSFAFVFGLFFFRKDSGSYFVLRCWQRFIFAIFFGGLMFYVFSEYRYLEEVNRLARYESAGIKVDRWPSEREVRLMTQLDAFISFSKQRASPNLGSEDLEFMRKVSWRYPYPPAIFRYAYALILNGRFDDAAFELQRLKGLHGAPAFNEAKLSIEESAKENNKVREFLRAYQL